MKGYINIPESVAHKLCRHCGGKPIIVADGKGGYYIKCQADDSHYQTKPGMIDIEDWNFYNSSLTDDDEVKMA